jgi:hypothetical protein
MMVRKLEEGFDKARAATFAYEATAMPMLTGTLITRVGFRRSAWRSRPSAVHLRDLRRDRRGAGDLVAGPVYFVPYLGTLVLQERRKTGSHEQPHELFDTVLRPLPPSSPGACTTAGRR